MTLRVFPIFGVVLFGVVLVLAAAPTTASAQVKGPAPYASEIRKQCIAEMEKDARILAACEESHSSKYQVQDAKRAVKDKQFVVAAYAAIWAILAIFVVVMWLRQRKLSLEITRLETELKKVAAE